jgi:cytochrome c
MLLLTVAMDPDIGRLGRVIQPHLAGQASTAPQTTRSLSDAVYTVEQAERGREAYAKACTYCHRDDLSGNEDGAPPLRGSAFLNRWKDRPISELYFVIKETMPQDEPKSLSANDCIDIVAFMLRRNEAPAGAVELPADMAVLGGIRLTAVSSP